MSGSEDWNFPVQCGSNVPFEVDITDPNNSNNPVDLTGATAEWIFAKNNGTTLVSVFRYTETSGLTLGGVLGTISGSLLPADTLPIATGLDSVNVQHQMFVTLLDQEPVLVQKGTVTFTPKLPVPAP